jgi:soluble lytic murein transglycosylase
VPAFVLRGSFFVSRGAFEQASGAASARVAGAPGTIGQRRFRGDASLRNLLACRFGPARLRPLAVVAALVPVLAGAQPTPNEGAVESTPAQSTAVESAPVAPLSLQALAAQDQTYLAIRDAFDRRDAARIGALLPQMRGHVLEPYAEHYLLRLRIVEASPQEIRAFLARYPNTVVAENVRTDWLKSVARMGDWTTFAAEAPALVGEDNEIACYLLESRAASGAPATFADLKPFWTAPRDLPDGCDDVARALALEGKIGPRQVWDRARIMVEAGRFGGVKRTLAFLPPDQRPDERVLDALLANPQRYLEKPKVEASSRLGAELTVLALVRLARMDAATAAVEAEARQQRLGAADRAYVWGQIATAGARNLSPGALYWYGNAEGAQLTDEQLAWRARAALREERWADVKTSIERMTPVGRNEPAWVYWQGRAEAALGNRAAAEQLYGRIAGEHHFYGKLATEELGRKVVLPPKGYSPSPAEVDAMAQNAGLQRALALLRLDQRMEGVREWNWSLRGFDDKQLLAAAEVARRNQSWDRAINAAEKTQQVHDFSVRFLSPYREVFRNQATAQGLEESWVLGLTRQESRFNANIRSSAGAMGLMQLMPATAKWVAKQNGVRDFKVLQANDVQTNVALGTYYLRHVLDELDGNPVLAAAAYNAGPNRAQRWRGARPLEGAIYIETIPFNETRDYVKKVMSNTVYYSALLAGDTRSLKSRLGTVPPRNADRMAAMRTEPIE